MTLGARIQEKVQKRTLFPERGTAFNTGRAPKIVQYSDREGKDSKKERY